MSTIQPNIEQPVSEEMQLVRRAKRGDDSAFEELVRRYDRNVFRIAQHITQNREDAEDVVQEAFLKAYGNLAKFQEQSKFYTWLVRIAVNEALKTTGGKLRTMQRCVDTAMSVCFWPHLSVKLA